MLSGRRKRSRTRNRCTFGIVMRVVIMAWNRMCRSHSFLFKFSWVSIHSTCVLLSECATQAWVTNPLGVSVSVFSCSFSLFSIAYFTFSQCSFYFANNVKQALPDCIDSFKLKWTRKRRDGRKNFINSISFTRWVLSNHVFFHYLGFRSLFQTV